MVKIKRGLAIESLRSPYFTLIRSLKVLLLGFMVLPIRIFVKSLYISFDSKSAIDGTGAQLQRLISVAALSKYFKLKFIPTEIEHFSVHPLDPFQSESSYRKQLSRLNQFIKFPNVESENIVLKMDSISISRLTIRSFTFVILRQILNPKPRKLLVLEVYPVSEFCPGFFSNFECVISETLNTKLLKTGAHLVIHYRQGVGGNVIYPGQKIPRQIEFSRILDFVRIQFDRGNFNSVSKITILTDAPDSTTFYTPPRDQLALWVGTPGFSNGLMTIQPMDFSEIRGMTGIELDVIRGGNPLEAIKMMASADFFVMSKSSLSFVGALLNKNGKIFWPTGFWHNPLPSWIKFDA